MNKYMYINIFTYTHIYELYNYTLKYYDLCHSWANNEIPWFASNQ